MAAYPPGATFIKQSSIQSNFDWDTASFRLHSNADKALNLKILAYVDNIYLRALKAKYVTYGNLSCLDVITSLNSTYYKIPPAALKDNSAHMTSAYYVSQLL